MNQTYDVLIVGGGPAGGLAAFLFAKAGRSVVLLEAHRRLPERVCGAYLCPAGVALLDNVCLRSELTRGMRSLLGMILVAPNENRLRTRFPGGFTSPDFGISLLRPEFDNRLLAAATRAGACIRMGAAVQEIETQGKRWTVRLQTGETLSAELLIGADGRRSTVARQLALSTEPWQKRVAIHVDLPSLAHTEPYGEMHVFHDGTYIGVNPIGPETLNLSALCDPDQLRGTTPSEFINRRVQGSRHLNTRIDPITDRSRIRATYPAAANVRQVVAPGTALIGDASGFLDPLTGEGIYQALWTALALTQEVTSSPRSAVNDALRRYARRRREQHRGKRLCCQVFQGLVQRPYLSNQVHRLLSVRQGVGDAFIGLIGNNYTPAQAAWNMVKALA
jgi:menaquinone-9 beta-reductase